MSKAEEKAITTGVDFVNCAYSYVTEDSNEDMYMKCKSFSENIKGVSMVRALYSLLETEGDADYKLVSEIKRDLKKLISMPKGNITRVMSKPTVQNAVTMTLHSGVTFLYNMNRLHKTLNESL